MATLGQLDCLNTAGNTGVGSCFFDPKNIIGAILAPKGYEFDVTTPQATLIAASHNAVAGSRIYPFYDFETTTDSTEAKTIQTMGTGAKHVVREGFNDWKFQYVSGGLSLLLEARLFNGPAWDFYFVDAQNNIIGIAGSTSTKLKAIPSTGGFFWAEPWKLNDASKITEYALQFVFNTTYANTKGVTKFVAAGFDVPTLLKGLQPVNLSSTVNATPDSYNVKVVTDAAQTNLGDLYPTTLASASLWVATNGTTGAAITITGVTYNATLGNFVLALDNADPDYPAIGGNIDLNLAAPAVLQAAGIDGYISSGKVTVLATS